MNESYEVVTAALTSHARTLDALTAELRQTRETAEVNLTGDAYGQIGQSFVAAAEALAQAGRDTLQSEVDALASATTAMRATVTEYERQESDSITRLAAVADGLGQEMPTPAGLTEPASTTDTLTTSAATVGSPEPVRLAAIDPATTTAAAAGLPSGAPPAPFLRTNLGFADTATGSGPSSTPTNPGTNSPEQNPVPRGVRAAQSADRTMPTYRPAGSVPDIGSANGRYGDNRTGPTGAILDAADLVMAPSLADRTATLMQVEAGVIIPDSESRLGAFAATHGYPQGTVGHAVHLGIAAIYMSLGDAGQETIGRVFNSPEARALYSQPIDSDANLSMARAEFGYWNNVLKEDPWSMGANIATQISPELRALAHRAFSILPTTLPPLTPPIPAPPVRVAPPSGQN